MFIVLVLIVIGIFGYLWFFPQWGIWLSLLFIISCFWLYKTRKSSFWKNLKKSEDPLEKRILTWAQIAAFVLGSLWALFTFNFQSLFLPSPASASICLNVDLKKSDVFSSVKNEKLINIYMQVTVTNTSTREVYLFPSEFTARGFSVKSKPVQIVPAINAEEYFKLSATPFLNNGETKISGEKMLMKDYLWDGGKILTVGNLFINDCQLDAGEKIVENLIFQIPGNIYDLVEVKSKIPYFDRDMSESVRAFWDWGQNNNCLELNCVDLPGSEEKVKISRDYDGSIYLDGKSLWSEYNASYVSLSDKSSSNYSPTQETK
jgi:hypothetical protein